MFDPKRCILEFNDAPAGILILEDCEYVFHAAADWAWPFDGTRDADLRAAERAIVAMARDRQGSEIEG